ncbi:hypothetical protein BGZ98_004714 [Dissophora globulifera]|nr:hypothetical protein BGZ98_004714 [Dissophora globulifera]
MILRNTPLAHSFRAAASLHRYTIHAFFCCLITTTYTHAQSTFQPTSVWGMSSVFIEGKSMYIHGGTAATTSPPIGQTFSIDLSTNWNTSQPTFKKLADDFSDYKYASALMSDNQNWFLLSNQTAHKYTMGNDTWSVIGTSGNVNNVQGLGAATDPSAGLIYIVNGWQDNGTISMQQYNPANNQIGVQPTQPTLAGVVSFAVAWSTVRQSLLVQGGTTITTNTLQRGLYEYVPNSGWTLLSDTGDVPPARKGHCMVPAYDGTKMVVFGGIDQSGATLGDIYFLDVATLPSTPAGTPSTSPTSSTSSAFSSAPSSTSTPSPSSSSRAIIAGVVGGIGVMALAAGFLIYRRKRRHQRSASLYKSESDDFGDNRRLGAGGYSQQSNASTTPDEFNSSHAYRMGNVSSQLEGHTQNQPLFYSDASNLSPASTNAYTNKVQVGPPGQTDSNLTGQESASKLNDIINIQGRGPHAITQWNGEDLRGSRNPQNTYYSPTQP